MQVTGAITILGGITTTPPSGASATQVQGTTAVGSAIIGNPVIIGGTDSAGNAQRIGIGPSGDSVSDTAVSSLSDRSLLYVWSGSAWQRMRTKNTFKSASATASGSTALWTPAAGKKFRLMSFTAGLTSQATQTTGGSITVQLLDSASGIGIQWLMFVPAAAISALGDTIISSYVDLGNGVLSAAANNVLNINLSAALTAGSIWVIAAGTEE